MAKRDAGEFARDMEAIRAKYSVRESFPCMRYSVRLNHQVRSSKARRLGSPQLSRRYCCSASGSRSIEMSFHAQASRGSIFVKATA